MNRSTRIITSLSLAMLGILCISSGLIYNKLEKSKKNKLVLVIVEQKQIKKEKKINIKLKNLIIDINTPLSIKIIDYLENNVTDEILANLKLDTSNVDVTKAGNYTYTLKYKNKTYQGIITVKETIKETTSLQSITLKSINIKKGTILTTDISNYVIETLTDEIKNNMLIDLSNVNINKQGNYQYTIKYNDSIYTSTITVTEEQPTLSTNIKEPNNKEEIPPTQDIQTDLSEQKNFLN